MSEENKNVELNDEDLENVTGGKFGMDWYNKYPEDLIGKTVSYMYGVYGPGWLQRCYGTVTDVVYKGSNKIAIIDGREVPFSQIEDGRY